MPSLGRLYVPDERDAQYPMALHIASVEARELQPRPKMWRSQLSRLDQGALGACVGFTGANWLGALPLYTRVTNQTGLDLYHACKQIDGIPDQEGTYDRALAKVLVQQGRIERYLWALTPTDVRDWVLSTGPIMVGTNWYDAMFDPAPDKDRGGRLYLHPHGSVVGGHEWLVRGYDPKYGYRMRNSWGPNWGEHGEAWIAEDDLYRLVFDEQGDALGAVEKRP